MLPGFTSRWIRPLTWAAASARATADRDPRGLSWRQRPGPPEDRRQVLAVDELHDDERTARIGAVVVDRDDIRVAERRGRLGLLAEARGEVGVAQVLGSKELEGHVATETGIGRPVDRRHPALADQLDETIATTEDLPDLRQDVPSAVHARPSGTDPRGIVPHAVGRPSGRPRLRTDSDRRQIGSARRYSRNSPARSGRASASSTEAFSQPIVVPAS